MSARLPLVATFAAVLAVLPPRNARADCMAGMACMDSAHPTSTGGAPVPKPDATTVQQTNVMMTANAVGMGISGQTITRADTATREAALAALQRLRDSSAQNATDPKMRDITTGTLDRLIANVKADTDFESTRPEIENIPMMLKVQVSIDSLLNGRDPSQLKPQEKKNYDNLNQTYLQLMPPAPKSADGGQASGAAQTSGVTAATTNGGTAATTNGGAAPATTGGSASASETLMNRFHDAYHESVENWNKDNPPGPQPPPKPGQPDRGNGQWSGLPPSGHLGGMIGANPGDASSWRLSSQDKAVHGDYRGALSDAQQAVNLGGGTPALVALGQAKYGLGDYPGAHRDAQTVLAAEPGDPAATALLHFTEGLGGPQSGPRSADGSGAAGGAGAAAAGAGAGGAFEAGGSAAAQASAAQLAAQAKNSLHLGDSEGAMSLLTRALALDGGNAELYALRAVARERLGDHAGAIADAKAGLALTPKDKVLLTTLGLAQLRGKDYKGALASANELLALNPDDAYALALRAHAYGSMGDRDAMMADLERAAALDPRFAPALAQAQASTQLPSDKDMIFLFPGEAAPRGAAAAAPAPGGRGRQFGLLVGAAALGGLLVALGLLQTVLAPLRTQVASVFTRLTGPAAGALRESDTAQPASVNGLLPGLIRGQYEVKRQIGAGGMGTVFEGTDRSLKRRVAIKKMRDELRVNPRDRERFVIEAKTVAALHHPNIVDIYAIAEEGQDVFLVFEYVDGKTVHDLVQSAGRLPIPDAARVVRAAADALGYAHSRGVVHRDMKPSNMMVDASGRVKVMDFGIARMAKDAMTRYSMTNTVVGTPPYMAPEQEQGHVRRESDVYALAVCAYEMLTGKLPFIGLGAGMLMNKINMSYVAPSRATAGLPEALDEVFTKAFQADPENRYRTPKEFADALESALPATARA